MRLQNVQQLATSQIVGGPGIYVVTVAGLVVTLPNWANWPDGAATVTVKDGTGSNTPNIRIEAPSGGTIDAVASVVMSNPGESRTFSPYLNGNTYVQT